MSARQQQSFRPEFIVPLAVRAMPPLGLLSEAARTPLDLLGSTLRAARNDVICRDGEAADACYRVEAGCLRVTKTLSDGRRHLVDFVFRGAFVGLGAEERCGFTVEAIGDCLLTRFPRRGLEALAERDLAAANLLRRAAAAALAAMHRRTLLLAHLSAEERLATFLLDLAARMNVVRRLPLPMARCDIADYLGMTPETLSRTFTRFRARGWIALANAQEVTILDRDRLSGMGEACALAA